MKNFLFYIIFLLSTINLSAQTYHPFIDTTKVWDIKFWYGILPYQVPDDYFCKYYFEGDTTINSIQYKKMYRKEYIHQISSIFDTLNRNPILHAFFREDTIAKKVYALGLACSDTTGDQLWLDFNLNIGDTVQYHHNSSKFIVNNKTLVALANGDSVYRFELRTSSGCCWEYFEEIGSTMGILNPFECEADFYSIIENIYCIKKNSTIIYESNANISCNNFNNIISSTEPIQKINIYSKSCFQDNIPFNLTFYNYFGLELKKIAKITEFCMQDFENGLYIVKIEQNEKTEFMKIYKN